MGNRGKRGAQNVTVSVGKIKNLSFTSSVWIESTVNKVF